MIHRWLLPTSVGLTILIIASLIWVKHDSTTVRAVPLPSQLYIDGKEVTAQDHRGFYYNGTSYVPATLEYEGTLYVPLRLVGSKLNKSIGWSEEKASIWLGNAPAPKSAKSAQAVPAVKPVVALNSTNALSAVSAFQSVQTHNSGQKISENPKQPQSQEKIQSQNQRSRDEHPALFGISIGDSVQQVLKSLGSPVRQEPSALGYEWYIYKNDFNRYLQVGVANGKVVDLYSNSPAATLLNIGIGTSYESLSRKQSLAPIVSFTYSDARVEVSNQTKQKPLALIDGTPVIFYLDQHDQNKVTAIRLLDRLQLLQGGFYETKWTYQGKAPNFDPPPLSIKQQELVNAAQERQILDLTNVIRYRHKLSSVNWNDQAARVAKAHSDDMESHQFFDHVSTTTGLNPFQRLQKAGLRYQMAGENIAAGYPDAIEAVENWMNSLGHRKNILEKGYSELGVGVMMDYYTQDFVTPMK
ncbi:CAP domain-containing protein [Brevibacillus ginsengisoli]|uniref:CAP domain-containing protein n=1 Tax=Brevibacillus ginsengisoli TaxID=363854 RepID=UPI003CF68EF1